MKSVYMLYVYTVRSYIYVYLPNVTAFRAVYSINANESKWKNRDKNKNGCKIKLIKNKSPYFCR